MAAVNVVMETLESGDHVVASNQVNPLVTFVTYTKNPRELFHSV